MKCMVCGFEVPEGAASCPVCGMAVNASEPAVKKPENVVNNESTGSGNKYSMAGGVTAASNPFGMDPSNQEARAAQEAAKRQMEMEARILDEPGAAQAPYYGQPGQPGQPQQRPLDLSAFDSGPKPFGGPMVSQPRTPANNNNKTLVIIMCVAVVAVLAIIALWRAGIFGGHKMNGTYKFLQAEANGRAYSPEELKKLGANVDDFQLKIDGSKATVRMMGRTGTAKISFDDGKIVITDVDQKIYGTYDEQKGTISLDVTGLTMVFKRE